MSPITVLLAEDHQMVRDGLRALLNLEKDIEVIAEANDGRQAVNLTKTLAPAVVVMDIAMPQLNGLEAARQILKSIPAKILMLSAHADPKYVDQVMELGVKGYLVKQTAAVMLPVAIREIHKGRTFFSPAISTNIQQQSVQEKTRKKGGGGRRLTSRETEVLQLIAEGMSTKSAAVELGLSIKTVEKHRQSLMDKLHIHDVASLTRYAILMGVIENPGKDTERNSQT